VQPQFEDGLPTQWGGVLVGRRDRPKQVDQYEHDQQYVKEEPKQPVPSFDLQAYQRRRFVYSARPQRWDSPPDHPGFYPGFFFFLPDLNTPEFHLRQCMIFGHA